MKLASSQLRAPFRRHHAPTWTAFGLVAVIIGIVMGCRGSVGLQDWNKRSWGPLIPHETFPGDCSLCHVPESWSQIKQDFTFDHEKETGISLEGAHQRASCLRCHNDRGPVAEFMARGCAGCHFDPHEGTLGSSCQECHNQRNWAPHGLLASHSQTRFPLIGAHLAVACDECHLQAKIGSFEGAPVRCDLCHQEDLGQALSPDHVAMGWTQSCEQCHVPTEWAAARFEHRRFPLTGAHAQASCTACHENNVFGPLPTDCFSCHQSDYVGANDPNHIATGFSTSCETCHTTSAWEPSTFNHERFFPIRQGNHSRLDCSECHTTGTTSMFSCVDCHEHRRSEMDDEHDEVQGYVYSSPACLSCHPNGRE